MRFAQQSSRPARAFTLIELVASLAAVSAIVMGLASAIHIAAMAMPGGAGQDSGAAIAATTLLDQIESELMVAHRVLTASGRTLEFVADDVTGDRVPDLVEYKWGGSSGDNIGRRVNGGSWSPMIEGVESFSVTPTDAADPGLTPSLARLLVGSSTRSSLTEFASGSPTLVSNSAGASVRARVVSGTMLFATSANPLSPADKDDWVPKSIRFRASSVGKATGTLEIRLCAADGSGVPELDKTYARAEISERLLAGSGFDWVTVEFTNVRQVPGGQEMSLVLSSSDTSDTASVLYSLDEPKVSTGRVLESNDRGATWNSREGAVEHEIWGESASGSTVAAASRAIGISLGVERTNAITVVVPLANTEFTP